MGKKVSGVEDGGGEVDGGVEIENCECADRLSA
jgi:hypothetical protein